MASPNNQYYTLGNYDVTLKASQHDNCFDIYSKNITVLDIPTGISEANSNNNFKVWINENSLLINSDQNSSIQVRNVLGQILFNSNHNKRHSFDLKNISSQILVVSIYNQNKTYTNKINFVKK